MVEKVKDKIDMNIIPLGYSVMLNYQLEIVGDESLTSIDHYDEFYVN